MTEINVRSGLTRRHMIDPVAFFAALVAAPLLVTLLTFWIILVPVLALAFGGLVYLAMSVPVLLWWLGRHDAETGPIAWLAFGSNLLFSAGIYLYMLLAGVSQPEPLALLYLVFGSVFAPLWAAVFARLYRRWRRPFFMQTV